MQKRAGQAAHGSRSLPMARAVLKWFADEGMADRYAVLLPALDVLRSSGVPVPEYAFVHAVDGWTLSAQRRQPPPAVVVRAVMDPRPIR